MYLPVKSDNFHYVPLSTAKRVKLEIVLSLIGHVGSNPTISARSRRFKRICDFFFCIKQRKTAFFLLQYALYIHNRKPCKGFCQDLFERLRKIIYNPRTDAQPCKAELFTVDCPRVKMIVIEKISKGQR